MKDNNVSLVLESDTYIQKHLVRLKGNILGQ